MNNEEKKISFRMTIIIISIILLIIFGIFFVMSQKYMSNTTFIVLSAEYETNILGQIKKFVKSNKELEEWLRECVKNSELDEKVFDELKVENQELLQYFDDDFFENSNLLIMMGDKPISINQKESVGIITVPSSGGVCYQTVFNFIILNKNIQKIEFDTSKFASSEVRWLVWGYISVAAVIIIGIIILKYNKKINNGLFLIGMLIAMYLIISVCYALLVV